ncbi:hypothetical protein Tco_1280873 [Tanacetum coccineum]
MTEGEWKGVGVTMTHQGKVEYKATRTIILHPIRVQQISEVVGLIGGLTPGTLEDTMMWCVGKPMMARREVELGEEDVEMEVFSRSLIGEVKKLSYLVKLPKLCDAVRLPKVKVKLLFGLEVMLVFETPGTTDNIMKNVDHRLRRWVHKISMRIAEEHGYVMEMNNCSLVGNQNITIGRVCVHTVTKGLIKEYLKIKVKDIIFKVSVIEEICNVVEYQVQESTNQEKNEEDGHGLMNIEEDEINDGEKKRRNSESDGSDEDENHDEEDVKEEKGDKNNPE